MDWSVILMYLLIISACFGLVSCADAPNGVEPLEMIEEVGSALGEGYEKRSLTTLLATIVYETEDGVGRINYHILQTTYDSDEAAEAVGLHTDAFELLFKPECMKTCEYLMIRDWDSALYKTEERAYLCWTCSPEISCILEYDPKLVEDAEIIKMAQSVGDN